jgi:hypothetical protein
MRRFGWALRTSSCCPRFKITFCDLKDAPRIEVTICDLKIRGAMLSGLGLIEGISAA